MEFKMKKLSVLAAAVAMTAGSLVAEGIQINKHLSLGGFIDMTYQNIDNDTAGTADSATFAVNQAELDVNINLGNGLSARVDLQANKSAANSATGVEFDNVEAEQARVDYNFGDWTLTLGKFDTFIGLEGLEPIDNYQYSSSLAFALEPTQHTGLALGYDNGFFNGALAVVNGIAVQNPDNNDEIGFALHGGITPTKAWAFNVNFATADEGAANGTGTTAVNERDTTLVTADIKWSNYGWTLAAEYAQLDQDKNTTTTADIENTAMSFMANYAFTERFAVTARYSVNEYDNGIVDTATSKDGDATEFSISPSYAFTPNWLGSIEYRSESVDAGTTHSGLLGNGGDADIITVQSVLSF